MESIYRVRANELDSNFVESLRQLFADRMIEIRVAELDETDYLLSSEANREQLLKAIANIESGENLVTVELDDYA